MNAPVPLQSTGLPARQLDADRLIERWREGRSQQTLRAYNNDLRIFLTGVADFWADFP